MTTYQILCIFGIPSLVGGTLVGFIISFFKKSKALEKGVQAILRDRLYQSYHHFAEEKGYAPLYARENFENMYQQYHTLGKNGVMDDVRVKFLALPSEPHHEEKARE